MNAKVYDLHCHSLFSDGLCSVDELVAKATRAGINVLALTDHDTVAGLQSFQKAAVDTPLKLINGIEVSIRWKKHDIHILGLNIDPESQALSHLNTQQMANRQQRGRQIAEKLSELGIENAYAKAHKIAGHDRVGRPHFARLLVEEGKVASMQDAFKRYLVRGRKAYIPTPWVDVHTAVKCIIEAGGDALIAHPFKYDLTRTRLKELITEFKQAGGVGMEVVSGAMTAAQAQEAAALCNQFELLASTGSDYHGDTISSVSLGRQLQLPVNCKPIWDKWE